MASCEGRRHRHNLVPLAALISRDLKSEKIEKPTVRYGHAAQSRKGEDYFLFKTDCQRVPGNSSSTFSVFAIFDGHNGNAAAIFTREHLLNHVLGAMPRGLGREEWLQALPRALVAGFVKTDKEFQSRGETSGTTATFVIVDGWTVTIASVGDSRCILDTQGGTVATLTVDHRLKENVEERERVSASGGEVGRLSIVGGAAIGPLRCWPGGLCLSRSIGDMDVGEYIVPIPFVKQVKLSNAGGRLIIASDGIWDAVSSEMAAKSCRGLPAELAAGQVVKEALRTRGLKDDTTCIVVDITPPDNSEQPSAPPKKQSKLRALFSRTKCRSSANKLSKKHSAVGIVEELFEEGSAMLAERSQEPYCRPFRCGDLDRIGFPFINITHPKCGPGIVSCNKETETIQLEIGERRYEVTSIRSIPERNNAYVLGIRNHTLWESLFLGKCEFITNSSSIQIQQSPPISFEIKADIRDFVRCDRRVPDFPDFGLIELNSIKCKDNYHVYHHTYPSEDIPIRPGCSIIQLPMKPGPSDGEPYGQIIGEFELQVNVPDDCSQCHEKGQCQIDRNNCPKKGKNKVLPIALATLSVAIGVLIVIGLSFRQKLRSFNVINLLKKESLTHQSVETFLRNNGPFGIRRYSYSDIKKMTNFLKDKLGQGGYGSVYKGKLQDGSLVAVKLLKGSTGNGEEFINEVASISRTSHVNIVTLRGFCFEGSKRALVYEFMPNGSLEKFIYKKDSPSDHQLQWETLYKIAVGIARGLEYLHRGCNTRILHFDIKPHNILLDENFCPKISDFGLAKVCPREQSIISMLGARGTAGYIAPEVFCRNIGGVSHKSDVYSYGMMVLEMLGGRKNIDAEVDRTSEIFFPHWIYRRLELDEELTLHGLMTEEDRQNAKKMTIVSLWCIQTDPSNRPAMGRVVEMLEMSLNSLQIPPKPFLSSPSRSEADSSTIVVESYSASIVP